jgi:hypothetical protein
MSQITAQRGALEDDSAHVVKESPVDYSSEEYIYSRNILSSQFFLFYNLNISLIT